MCKGSGPLLQDAPHPLGADSVYCHFNVEANMEPITILIALAIAAMLLTRKKSGNASLVAEKIPDAAWGILDAALSPSVTDDATLAQLQQSLLDAASNTQGKTLGPDGVDVYGAWRLNQFAMAIQAKRNALQQGQAVTGSNLEAIRAIALVKMPKS